LLFDFILVENLWSFISYLVRSRPVRRFQRTQTWNLGHPPSPVLTEELSLRRECFRLIEGPPHHVAELIRRLFLRFHQVKYLKITPRAGNARGSECGRL